MYIFLPAIYIPQLRLTSLWRKYFPKACVLACSHVVQLCPLHLGCMYTKDKCGTIMVCTNLYMLRLLQ
jgi:hypothetical protein